MKVSKEKVARNRAALIDAARLLLNEKGFEGTSVAEISAKAGLTQGAFYRQFATKDELIALACRLDLASRCERWEAEDSGRSSALAYIDDYLQYALSEDPTVNRPLAAYAAEIARQPKNVMAAFADGTAQIAKLMEYSLRKTLTPALARRRALFLVASLAGVVAIARAINSSNPELAGEILSGAAIETKKLMHPPSKKK
ncbi:transcriptional regulator, TetR family [Cupriavidus sp. YR651]|uniref:TetR/AcrR family transcriptional regulator n=1 Tax=Cupriavidus sp. YR651 TaxID=1855315 RepID=UPI00087F2A3C|nr:TetR/AcrR family transcriptional regulator [Cupriavidus sp. YR651]SDD99134.1 transcriptional regulator, TetR family [Cupriavidus sp. YR651]